MGAFLGADLAGAAIDAADANRPARRAWWVVTYPAGCQAAPTSAKRERRPRRNGAPFCCGLSQGLRVGPTWGRSRWCTAGQKLERCAVAARRTHEVRKGPG